MNQVPVAYPLTLTFKFLTISSYIRVVDANYSNRGELLLEHQHAGIDLRADYARETLGALVRVWKRPVGVATKLDNKPVLLRYDGKEHSTTPYKV